MANLQKYRKKIPQIAILLETSHEISRGMLRGIFKYIRLFGPWRINVVAGGAQDQRLPDTHYWKGNGIIGRSPNSRLAEEILNSQLPFVIIDPTDEYLDVNHPFSKIPRVRCNSQSVGILAANYLMSRNIDHYGFVGEINQINWSRIRQRYFIKTLNDFGHSCFVYPTPNEEEKPWEIELKLMCRWLRQLPKPAAVFVANDHRARQVLDACLAIGITVPYQLAILGVNNDELICQSTQPQLSSIALDSETAGFAAAEMLNDLMFSNKRRNKNNSSPIYDFYPKEVISRDSTRSIYLNDQKVIKGMEFIRINGGLNIRVSDVVEHIGITRQWADKLFQKEVGTSILKEIQRVRMNTIRSLVANTNLPFQEIALQCGFEGSNHLGIIFKKEFGLTMSEFRENNANETVG